jgi:hypothetical protein
VVEEDLVVRAKRPVDDGVVEIVMLEIQISIIQSFSSRVHN